MIFGLVVLALRGSLLGMNIFEFFFRFIELEIQRYGLEVCILVGCLDNFDVD